MAEPDTPACEAILIAARDVARTLGVSERHVWRLRDAGVMPAPVKLGAAVRWRRDEVLQWVAAGCPSLRKSTSR